MATPDMLMVFSYDITDNRRRRKVAALLEDHAVRVQKSVFEARMSESAAARLATQAAQHLDTGDSLRVYAISAAGRRRTQTYGATAPILDGEYYLL